MATGTIRLTGTREYVKAATIGITEESAKQIITSLKIRGPYWTGDFEKGWTLYYGDKSPSRMGDFDQTFKKRWKRSTRQVTPYNTIGSRPASDTGVFAMTIFNISPYANFAMDLAPMSRYGKSFMRWEDEKQNTAPKDWYRKYVTSPAGLRQDIVIGGSRFVRKAKFQVRGNFKTIVIDGKP